MQSTGHHAARIIRRLCEGGKDFLEFRHWQGQASQQRCPPHLDLFKELVPARNANTLYTAVLLKLLMSIRILLQCNSDVGDRR